MTIRACAVLGSSFAAFSQKNLHKIVEETPFGAATVYALRDRASSFLQFRHGLPHQLLPTQINWRAQAWILKKLQIDVVLLTSSVGVLDEQVPLYTPLLAQDLLMPFNQLPDGTVCTMFPSPSADHGHLLLQDGIFHRELRKIISAGLQRKGQRVPEVVFGYVPGPRTKTAAENRYWKSCGAQVNSMSIGPEAVLLNELEIPVAALLIGHKYSLPNAQKQHSHESIAESLNRARECLWETVEEFLHAPPAVSFSNHIYRFPQ